MDEVNQLLSMLNKRWQSACRIRHAVGVCKPPEGVVYKRHGAERSGKRYPIPTPGVRTPGYSYLRLSGFHCGSKKGISQSLSKWNVKK